MRAPNTVTPFIQIFDPSLLSILAPNVTIRSIASNPGFAFAHEAPIYDAGNNLLFFSSSDGGPPEHKPPR
ncbi:hypothetical protein BJ138DRAFT_796749 [Hygrophoropsis aurantiaca]|uniref:Uncharacterized protein n=1 Tax=Hygrophoropsis aurantiaca TaxID=72124 RepID=A0ACB7ZX73_9AGAM|nr:hypothetical protein BJ138DRAFT_796749 [Hygrophoropsis aurantiaca]